MEQMEPLISSSVAGPLGIAHLPRLWLKILLNADGKLPEGYRAGVGGFDEMLCDKLGIDRDAFVAYISSEKPDYLTLERWVEKHATALTPRNVQDWNTTVRTRQLRPEMAAERRARFGIDDEDFAHGVSLNDLDDWAGFHARLTAAVPAGKA